MARSSKSVIQKPGSMTNPLTWFSSVASFPSNIPCTSSMHSFVSSAFAYSGSEWARSSSRFRGLIIFWWPSSEIFFISGTWKFSATMSWFGFDCEGLCSSTWRLRKWLPSKCDDTVYIGFLLPIRFFESSLDASVKETALSIGGRCPDGISCPPSSPFMSTVLVTGKVRRRISSCGYGEEASSPA